MNIDTLRKKAEKAYEKEGQQGVYALADTHKELIKHWGYCKGCDCTSPAIENSECLVCGQTVEKQLDEKSKCPVCNRHNTRSDFDSPDTMRCCDDCGADYLIDGIEVTLDPRDELSLEEIKSRGYNPL